MLTPRPLPERMKPGPEIPPPEKPDEELSNKELPDNVIDRRKLFADKKRNNKSLRALDEIFFDSPSEPEEE